MRYALFCDIAQHRVVIMYRHFGTTYRPHLQGSRSPRRYPLKMGPTGCPEPSVHGCHSVLRNIPEGRKSPLHRGGSLKSRTYSLSGRPILPVLL